jgi:membrane protease YdiL (CAAX protease family)
MSAPSLSHRWNALWTWVRREHQGPTLDAGTLAVFVVATLSLTFFYYFGRAPWFRGSGLQEAAAAWLPAAAGPWLDLLPYLWWAFCSITLRVLLPALTLGWIRGRLPADEPGPPPHLGLGMRGWWAHMPLYGLLYLAMLPVLVWASSLDSFQHSYPFYGGASRSGLHWLAFEVLYGLQFLGVEAFFRGFLLFGLWRRFGWYSVFISAVPYVMIHFGKPLPETLGALLAGILLCALAWRSQRVWPGVILHWAIAITMDGLALWRTSSLPATFWPPAG